MPLQESLINLNTSTSVLQDAIEKQKLVQLPISVQKEVLANLEAIARFVKGLSDGGDEIINLTGAIARLSRRGGRCIRYLVVFGEP